MTVVVNGDADLVLQMSFYHLPCLNLASIAISFWLTALTFPGQTLCYLKYPKNRRKTAVS